MTSPHTCCLAPLFLMDCTFLWQLPVFLRVDGPESIYSALYVGHLVCFVFYQRRHSDHPCSYSFAHSGFPKEASLASYTLWPQLGPLDIMLGSRLHWGCVRARFAAHQRKCHRMGGPGHSGLCSPRLPLPSPSGPKIGDSHGVLLLLAPELEPHCLMCTHRLSMALY